MYSEGPHIGEEAFKTIGCQVKIYQRGPKMQKCKGGDGTGPDRTGREEIECSPKPQIVETCRLEQWFLTSFGMV